MKRRHERTTVSLGGVQASFAETQSEPGEPSRNTASRRLSSLVSIRRPVPICWALGGYEIELIGSEVIFAFSDPPGRPVIVHTSIFEVEATEELTAAMYKESVVESSCWAGSIAKSC